MKPQVRPVPPPPAPPSDRPALAAAVILGAVLLAWANSLAAPFLFDDYGSILDNATIRHLWPPDWLRPPATAGETVSGRPVLNLTFALNHALGGLDVRGYHAVNLLIHVAAALVLFGLVRRTLGRTERPGGAPATLLAAAVALLWAVHPLQVESVTYVVQRAESLGGLLCLLTLYAFIRGTGVETVRARRGWMALAIASCLVGVGTKETVVVMPVIVLLWDRTFLAGSFGAAWRARGGVHAALFATWLPLAALVLGIGGTRGGTFAFTAEGFWLYWLTQCKAVVWYLKLVVWPAPLVFDRAFFRLTPLEAMPYALVLVPLLGATLWGLWKRTAAGFAGASFFLLLAPSSLMPGLLQVIVEHRMYLALAAPLALLAALLRPVRPRVAVAVVALVAGAFGTLTFARNRVYRSGLSLWADTAAKAPDNPRARYNLGLALAGAGRTDEAAAEFRQALALRPEHAFAHFELAKIALLAGRLDEAAGGFSRALEADPHFVNARVNLARVQVRLGRADAAAAGFRQALADEPGAADIRGDLAGLLIQQGRAEEAREVLLGAARPDDGLAQAWFALGNLLARQQRFTEALPAYQAVVARDPANLKARANLANCLLALGRNREAIAEYEAILAAQPENAAVRANLAVAREMLGSP